MMKLTTFFVFFVSLCQFSLSLQAEDFENGLKAYNQGNFKLALEEWSALAKNGHSAAQANLGVMYVTGSGVPQSYKKAMELFESGSKSNLGFAQYNLALMYEKGQGVAFDNLRAYMWYNIASGNGSKISLVRRNDVARFMTKSQIEKAQKLTEKCIKTGYLDC